MTDVNNLQQLSSMNYVVYAEGLIAAHALLALGQVEKALSQIKSSESTFFQVAESIVSAAGKLDEQRRHMFPIASDWLEQAFTPKTPEYRAQQQIEKMLL
jgi:hypothetical protein